MNSNVFLDRFHVFCSPFIPRREPNHEHRAAKVTERPSASLRTRPLCDLRGSVLVLGKRKQPAVYRNHETALVFDHSNPIQLVTDVHG